MEREDLQIRAAFRREKETFSSYMKGERIDGVDTPEGKALLDSIRQHPDLEILELTGSSYKLEWCLELAELLKSKTNLRVVLFDDMFTGRKIPEIHPALSAFARTFQTYKHLTVLDLSDNAVNPDGAICIAPLISSCLTLKKLILNNTGVGPAGGDTIGKALYSAYERGQSEGPPYQLEVFVLGRSRLEREGALAISKAFKAIGTLKEIRMNNNGIYEEGIVAIARAIAFNPHLEVLELSDNAVKRRGSRALGKALTRCPELRALLLETTLLRDQGGVALVEGLAGCDKLATLDFGYNEMGAAVVDTIIRVLKDKPLRVFNANGNVFSHDDVERLQAAFSDSMGDLDENDSDNDDEFDEEDGCGDDVVELPGSEGPSMPSFTAALDQLTMASAGPKVTVPVANAARVIQQATDKAAVTAETLQAYRTYPNALRQVFVELCQGKDKAATRAVLEYSLSAAVGLRSAFLNSVLVGLALLKPETTVYGKTKAEAKRANLEETIPESVLPLVFNALAENKDLLDSSSRTVLTTVAGAGEIRTRSQRPDHAFLAQGPYLKMGHPANAAREACIKALQQ
eukprot:m.72608 g.72608  ORF g.72608 m.72608 type:complete len:573 (+) comp14273_c0_seq1:51-1769(+)